MRKFWGSWGGFTMGVRVGAVLGAALVAVVTMLLRVLR
jgi:hypothetical protein